jgi:hypothetical protein
MTSKLCNASQTRIGSPAGASAAMAFIFVTLYSLYFTYNLGYFYNTGAAVYDPGWFAWLARHGNHWPLPNPAVIGGDFLAAHFSPIFLFTSFLSKLVPLLPAVIWFSVIFSLWLPLLVCGIFVLLGNVLPETILGRVAAAVLLALSGLSLSMFSFPHIESFIEPLLLLTLALLLGGAGALRLVLAVICFGLMLSVREDAGLHAFLVLAALGVLSWRKSGRVPAQLVAFAIFGVAYSAVAVLIQTKLIPQGGHAFSRVYLGSPPFAHLTRSFLITRGAFWTLARLYIFLPLALLLLSAIRHRELALLLGFAIAVPWLALSFVAISPFAGGLWGYYCFPLAIPCLWPTILLASGLYGGANRGRWLRLQIEMGSCSAAVFILLGVLPGIGNGTTYDRAPWRYLAPPSIQKIFRTQAAVVELQKDKILSHAIVDDGVGSLMLGSLAPGQYEGLLVFDPEELSRAAAFIRFIQPPENLAPRVLAITAKFPACTAVTGTSIEICLKTIQHDTRATTKPIVTKHEFTPG